jgi:hypothetical protein
VLEWVRPVLGGRTRPQTTKENNMYIKIKNNIIDLNSIKVVSKKYATGGETLVIKFKDGDEIEIYFYGDEEARDSAFDLLYEGLMGLNN